MAIFFNKKEEVISLELTQHGKFLLSQGKFRPAHYSFYDDDILYDGGHAAVVSGSQNENLTRISATPRLKSNLSYGLADSKAALNDSEANSTKTANFAYSSPLGTSDSWKEAAPAWSIRPILDSIVMASGSTNAGVSVTYKRYEGRGLNVPQLNVELTCEYETGEGEDTIKTLKESPRLLLAVEELNTVFKRDENFEIEVYEVENALARIADPSIKEELRKLKFASLGSDGEKRALGQTETDPTYHAFATAEEQIEEEFPVLNSNHVEFYMSFKSDSEIEELTFPTEPNPLYQPRVGDEDVGDACDD